MKVCDKCNSETKSLTVLLDEFDGLEVCDSCRKQLEQRCLEIQNRLTGVRERARKRAFAAWKGEDFEPANIKAVRWSFRSLIEYLIHIN